LHKINQRYLILNRKYTTNNIKSNGYEERDSVCSLVIP
jgi:hypothetical protein